MDNITNSTDIDLKEFAKRLRISAIKMTHFGKSSHVGSILSIADILAVLYQRVLNFDPKYPKLESRDRFILSKGHAGAGVYAALAQVGFFCKSELNNHCKDGSNLSGHISHKNIPGVELSTGSLGHGLPVSAGIALASKLKRKNYKTFVLMSDGECDEGSNWEAALFSAHHKLNNLVAIIDYNKLQSIKSTEETLGLEPFGAKWKSFGWEVFEVDGHNHNDLIKVLSFDSINAKKPRCIIAHTIKGCGVSFMENKVLWHYRSPQGEEYKEAISELED